VARRKKLTRGELVAKEAMEWIGTPFHWQAAQKGVGCDCKGLVWGVARELGFPEAETFYATVADYGRNVPSDLLREGMAAVFAKVDSVRAGDVLLLRVRGKAQHLAIALNEARAVHAQLAPRDWVKETSLRALTKLCPVDSIWRWRDGD
jgi:cell wall-associated NlpC family hydrolase